MIPLHCFKIKKESKEYLIKLNEIHPSLKFTSEKEKSNVFLFLTSMLNSSKRVMKAVSTTNQCSLAKTYSGNLLHTD